MELSDRPAHIMPDSEMPKRYPKVSFGMLLRAVENAWARFPVTLAYIVCLTVWIIVNIWADFKDDADNLVYALWYLLGVGVMFTLAVSLWCEIGGKSQRLPLIVVNVLLVIDAGYILIYGSDVTPSWCIGRLALVISFVVAILFAPSRKPWAWNYTEAQLTALIVALAFFWGFGIAVGIIFLTLSGLFGFENTELMLSVSAVCSSAVPSVIFLHLIPRRKDAELMELGFRASKFQCGTAKYFFLLLTVVYMAILYAYGLKILFTWELPRGVVSWSVTGLVAAVFLTLFFLEGVRRTNLADVFTLRALRLLPVAMLPLLVLMSVAVMYRIAQYGLTVSRLYLIAFNVWCYGVFLYLAFRHPGRCSYNSVAISFAIVFVVTSVFPFANFTNLSNTVMRSKLRTELENAGFSSFPVSGSEFKERFETLAPAEKKGICSKIEYLDTYKDHSLLDGIVDFNSHDDSEILRMFINAELDSCKPVDKNRVFESHDGFVEIPTGYSRLKHASYYKYSPTKVDGGIEADISGTAFSVPVDSLLALPSKDVFTPPGFLAVSGNRDTIFVPSRIRINYGAEADKDSIISLELNGCIFMR